MRCYVPSQSLVCVRKKCSCAYYFLILGQSPLIPACQPPERIVSLVSVGRNNVCVLWWVHVQQWYLDEAMHLFTRLRCSVVSQGQSGLRAVWLEAGGTFLTSSLRGIRPLKGEGAYLIRPFKGFGGWRAVHVISQAFWAVEVSFIRSCERQQCYFSGKGCMVLCLLRNVIKLVRLWVAWVHTVLKH